VALFIYMDKYFR